MGALTTGLIFCFFILTIYEFLRRRKLFMARKRLGLSGPTPDYFTGNIKDMIIPAFKVGWLEKKRILKFVCTRPLIGEGERGAQRRFTGRNFQF